MASKKKQPTEPKRYRMLVGANYPTNPDEPREQWAWKRVEAGDLVDDLPAKSIKHLLAAKEIEDPDAADEEGE